MNQRDQILEHLKSGKTITPLEALNQYGCLRLGARIWDLRRAGFSIGSEMIETVSGKRVARYRMAR